MVQTVAAWLLPDLPGFPLLAAYWLFTDQLLTGYSQVTQDVIRGSNELENMLTLVPA